MKKCCILLQTGFHIHSKNLILLSILILTFFTFKTDANSASVILDWNAINSSNLVGYKIYYGISKTDFDYSVKVEKATSCTISGLKEGKTYYFAATSYSSNGDESDFSNTVSKYISATQSDNPTSCDLDAKFEEGIVQVGETYYPDRAYTLTSGIPSWMEGRTLIKTPNDERSNASASNYIRFETPVSYWVYVLFDSRASRVPDWLEDWEFRSDYKVQTSLTSQPYLEVWRKYYDAGECVNLGGNYGPGSSDETRSNYIVVYGK